jgi:Flp pilus assembly protein TadG
MELTIVIVLLFIVAAGSFIFGAFFAKQRIEYVAQTGMLSYMEFLKGQIGQQEYNRINREYLEEIGIRIKE